MGDCVEKQRPQEMTRLVHFYAIFDGEWTVMEKQDFAKGPM